jgi:predicted GNAT family N-acyltransferase
VDVDAQTYALPFYHSFGFVEQGKEFLDAGLPHIKMILKL